MSETIGMALSELKRRAGLSLSAIAKAAGYSGPSSVQAFFHPDYDPPSLDLAVAHKLAAALEGKGKPAITAEEIFALARVGTQRLPTAKPRGVVHEFTPSDHINVYETRHGGFVGWGGTFPPRMLECFLINMSRRVREVPMQAGLNPAQGVFAIFVAGVEMTPKFVDGDPVFVDPTRSAARGEDALIFLSDSGTLGETDAGFTRVILGMLIRRGEEDILVRQHRRSRSVRVPTREISAILRVVPWGEVCGVSYA